MEKNCLIVALFASRLLSATPVPISVIAFDNKAPDNSCNYDYRWWHDNMGTAFKEMLLTELKAYPQFEILERAEIGKIFEAEHRGINSEYAKKPRKGKFRSAKLVFAGAVTDFEFCETKTGGGLDVGRLLGVGSLSLGMHKVSAMVSVDVRVIDVETGRIVEAVQSNGSVTDHAIQIDTDNSKIHGNLSTRSNSSAAKAARKAIKAAARSLKIRLT